MAVEMIDGPRLCEPLLATIPASAISSATMAANSTAAGLDMRM
jgi:hypothetical protein